MSAADKMPARVRELIDRHGPGIPHFSHDGPYLIDVYPRPEFKTTFWGHAKMIRCPKVVTVINRKTGECWVEEVAEFKEVLCG